MSLEDVSLLLVPAIVQGYKNAEQIHRGYAGLCAGRASAAVVRDRCNGGVVGIDNVVGSLSAQVGTAAAAMQS